MSLRRKPEPFKPSTTPPKNPPPPPPQVLLDYSCLEVFTSTGQALAARVNRGAPPPDAVDPCGLALIAMGGAGLLARGEAHAMRSMWEPPPAAAAAAAAAAEEALKAKAAAAALPRAAAAAAAAAAAPIVPAAAAGPICRRSPYLAARRGSIEDELQSLSLLDEAAACGLAFGGAADVGAAAAAGAAAAEEAAGGGGGVTALEGGWDMPRPAGNLPASAPSQTPAAASPRRRRSVSATRLPPPAPPRSPDREAASRSLSSSPPAPGLTPLALSAPMVSRALALAAASVPTRLDPLPFHAPFAGVGGSPDRPGGGGGGSGGGAEEAAAVHTLQARAQAAAQQELSMLMEVVDM